MGKEIRVLSWFCFKDLKSYRIISLEDNYINSNETFSQGRQIQGDWLAQSRISPPAWDWTWIPLLQLFVLDPEWKAGDTWFQERVNLHSPAAMLLGSPGGNLVSLKSMGMLLSLNELLRCGHLIMA